MRLSNILSFSMCVVMCTQCKPRNNSELSEVGQATGTFRGLDLINAAIQQALFYQAPQDIPLENNNQNESSAPALALAPSAPFEPTSRQPFNLVSGMDVNPDSMRTLLGSYEISEGRWEFKGAEPNPFNTMLWQTVLLRFARKISELCAGETPTIDPRNLHPKSLALVRTLCDSDPSILDKPNFETTGNRLGGAPAALAPSENNIGGENIPNSPSARPLSTPEQVRTAMTDIWNLLVGYESSRERDAIIASFEPLMAKGTLKGQLLVERYFFAMTFNPNFLLVR